MKLRAVLVVCTVALCALLAGCATSGTASNSAQQANRAYMSQVNETMVELDDSLASFVSAVSRGDVVTMRTQADNAFKVLDKLAGVEAPDALKDVSAKYAEGTAKLREALNDYIDLYTELSSKSADFDEAAYNERIAQIQAQYDEGVALLQAGDETAAAASSSQSGSSAAVSAAAAGSASATDSASAPAGDASAASSGSGDSPSSASATAA